MTRKKELFWKNESSWALLLNNPVAIRNLEWELHQRSHEKRCFPADTEPPSCLINSAQISRLARICCSKPISVYTRKDTGCLHLKTHNIKFSSKRRKKHPKQTETKFSKHGVKNPLNLPKVCLSFSMSLLRLSSDTLSLISLTYESSSDTWVWGGEKSKIHHSLK